MRIDVKEIKKWKIPRGCSTASRLYSRGRLLSLFAGIDGWTPKNTGADEHRPPNPAALQQGWEGIARKLMKPYRISIVVLLTLALGACGNATPTNIPSSAPVGQTPVHVPDAHLPRTQVPWSVANLIYTATASPISTATLSVTLMHPTIHVTAVKGNVFIRRGPDLAFNTVSVLMDGQSVKALGRDVLANWLQVSIPDHPKETGWISIQTRFVTVNGDIMTLPEIMPTDWPVRASLRNCTYHQMEANPGGIAIPAAGNFPDNDVQINPGVYTIHDIEVGDSPDVMEVEVKEGSHLDILDDGDGNHKKCALPK
jgi:hypothetical protein